LTITVNIPTPLRPATGGAEEVRVRGATVGDALDSLFDEFGGVRDHIWVDGKLARFVNVYVGSDDIRVLRGLETPLGQDDEMTILPAVAGG
jgi:molybdopterin synthase sulfur carrier subunit